MVLIQEEGAIVAAGVGAEGWIMSFFIFLHFLVLFLYFYFGDCFSASLRRPNLPVGHLLDLFQDPLPLVLDQSRVRSQGISS